MDSAGAIQKLEEQPRENFVENPESSSYLLTHWDFADVERDESVTDSWKNQSDGVYEDRKGSETSSGIIDGALRFEGPERVNMSKQSSQFTRLDEFMISGWVRDPMKDGADIFSLSDETAIDQVYFKAK